MDLVARGTVKRHGFAMLAPARTASLDLPSTVTLIIPRFGGRRVSSFACSLQAALRAPRNKFQSRNHHRGWWLHRVSSTRPTRQ